MTDCIEPSWHDTGIPVCPMCGWINPKPMIGVVATDVVAFPKDRRCYIGRPEFCSAMGTCPICSPGSPEFDGRGGGVSWWPDENGVLQSSSLVAAKCTCACHGEGMQGSHVGPCTCLR